VKLEKILYHGEFLDLSFSSITVRAITPSRMGWARGVKKGKKKNLRNKIHIGF
jgi:hypothetical protein